MDINDPRYNFFREMRMEALPIALTLLGFWWWDEKPSLTSLIGGGIALIGAMITYFYQEQRPLLKPSGS